MNESLFKAVPQSQGAIVNGETTFEFLQRGGRTEAIEIRQWIENWFRKYPEDHGEELSKRLQSKKFAEFMSAYFELQIFSVLCRIGCDVEIHPDFADTHGKVDFGVTHGEDVFYVEATVCGTEQGILHSNANEEDAVRKIRDAIPHPHSDVWIDAEGELLKTLGDTPPRRPDTRPSGVLLARCRSRLRRSELVAKTANYNPGGQLESGYILGATNRFGRPRPGLGP